MKKVDATLMTANYSQAKVDGAGEAVHVRIDPATQWDADGLLELAALLVGMATILTARKEGQRK